jgi:hypothetical protein
MMALIIKVGPLFKELILNKNKLALVIMIDSNRHIYNMQNYQGNLEIVCDFLKNSEVVLDYSVMP